MVTVASGMVGPDRLGRLPSETISIWNIAKDMDRLRFWWTRETYLDEISAYNNPVVYWLIAEASHLKHVC